MQPFVLQIMLSRVVWRGHMSSFFEFLDISNRICLKKAVFYTRLGLMRQLQGII